MESQISKKEVCCEPQGHPWATTLHSVVAIMDHHGYIMAMIGNQIRPGGDHRNVLHARTHARTQACSQRFLAHKTSVFVLLFVVVDELLVEAIQNDLWAIPFIVLLHS